MFYCGLQLFQNMLKILVQQRYRKNLAAKAGVAYFLKIYRSIKEANPFKVESL